MFQNECLVANIGFDTAESRRSTPKFGTVQQKKEKLGDGVIDAHEFPLACGGAPLDFDAFKRLLDEHAGAAAAEGLADVDDPNE